MTNILILAKKAIYSIKINKFKKYKFLTFVLFFIITGCLISNTQNVNAAYKSNSENEQVKTSDKATVYYINRAKGIKKVYVNAKAFLAYNNKWSDIKIIDNKELNKLREVKLVKSKNNSAVYHINGNQKTLIESEQQFINSGYKWSDIITVAQADLNEYKNTEQKIAGAIDNYNNENQLSISLDSSSPKPVSLALNTQDNLVAVFNLKNNGKLVEIKNLTLNLKGLFVTDAIKKIYITDENNIPFANSPSLQNRQVIFHFNSKPLLINNGETRKIKVYINFNNISSDITNNTIQIAINQTSNIDATNNTKIEGAFPLLAETFKLVPGGDFLGKIIANEQSLSSTDNTVIIGSTEKNVGKFNLAEISGAEDIAIKELKFINNGDARADSLNSFKLKNNNNQVVATAEQLTDDKELIFKLNNYKIKKQSNETFTILANIIDNEKSIINFNLEETKIASSLGNFNLNSSITNLDEIITIKRAAIGATAKKLTANNYVFSKQAGSIIGNFEIKNNNQKIKLERLGFSLEKSANAPNLGETIYLVNYDSGEIYGNFNNENFSNGVVNVNLNNLTLNAKQSLTVALIAKINNNAINGSFYKITLNNIDYRAENGSYYSDAVNIANDKIVINKSNLYLYPNDIKNQSYTKGEKNIKIASFIAEAAAGENVEIIGLTFSHNDSSGIISFPNGFSNLRATIGSTRTNTIKEPYSNDLIFNNFKYTLKAGTRTEINVYTDTEVDLKTSEIQLKISDLITAKQTSINNLNINSYKTTFGEVRAEINKVADGFVTKGENDNVIAGFKIKNTGNENLKLQSIVINTANQQLTYSLGFSNLKIINRDKQERAGYEIGKPVAGANTINLGNYPINAGEEIIFDVHIKTNNNVIDKNIIIYFSNFTAQGQTSKISATISGDPTDSFEFTSAISNSNEQPNNKVETFIKPVVGSVTYGFHDSSYPFRDSFEHTGIDIAVAQGTKIKAVASGIVLELTNGVGDQASYVTIKHNNNLITRYAHLSLISVRIGDKIKQGDIIGLSGGQPGTSGAGKYSTGPHLHFEVLENNMAVDPQKYL